MTSALPTPGQLLAAAKAVLSRAADWGPAWPQAVALFSRQSLEDAIDLLWVGPTAGMRDCPMAHQLICLPYFLDPDVAHQANETWHALSGACHAHPYALSPTLGELRGWITEVERLLVAIRAAG